MLIYGIDPTANGFHSSHFAISSPKYSPEITSRMSNRSEFSSTLERHSSHELDTLDFSHNSDYEGVWSALYQVISETVASLLSPDGRSPPSVRCSQHIAASSMAAIRSIHAKFLTTPHHITSHHTTFHDTKETPSTRKLSEFTVRDHTTHFLPPGITCHHQQPRAHSSPASSTIEWTRIKSDS